MSYTPDRVFVKRLKELDENLGCHYERGHHHFIITYKRAVGGEVPIMCIETADGGFRHPDNRDIETLKKSDMHREGVRARMKRVAQYMEDSRTKQRAIARSNIRDMTKDNKIQLSTRAARLLGGKHNSAFRRITPKGKGMTAAQILNSQGR